MPNIANMLIKPPKNGKNFYTVIYRQARRILSWQETEKIFTEEKTEDARVAYITMGENTSLYTDEPIKRSTKR